MNLKPDSTPANAPPAPPLGRASAGPTSLAAPAPSLPEQLFRRLSEDIANGVFPPGSRLPTEPELCVRYEVSRTVLREAAARLRADGVIDAQQGRGSYVLGQSLRTPFRFDPSMAGSPQGIQQLAELRLGVEGMAAALAATRRSAAHLAQLQDCLDRMQQAARDGTSGSAADLEFHLTIADATGNDYYRSFMAYLRGFYAVAIDTARTHSARTPGLSDQAQAEHEAIYRAIAGQDAPGAEAAVQCHVRNAAQRLAAQGG